MSQFDPNFYHNLWTIPSQSLINAVNGGILISLASSLYFILFGNILGMSGLIGNIVKFAHRHATRAKIIVVLGLLFAASMINFLNKNQIYTYDPYDKIEYTQDSSVVRLILAGLLVGVGTELGSGCTSGHGLCGMPRFSLRSYIAVIIFLTTGIVVATAKFYEYLPDTPQQLNITLNQTINPVIYLAVTSVLALAIIIADQYNKFIEKIVLFVIGVIFGVGLMVAGMTQRTKIYGFLELNSKWDPSLLIVLMTGVSLNIITFSIMRFLIKKPLFGDKLADNHGHLTWKLVVGAFLFGIGWGLGGLCPGPFILSLPVSLRLLVFWGVPCMLGMRIIHAIFDENTHHEVHLEKPKTN